MFFEPEFWVAVAFVLLMILFAYLVFALICAEEF